VIDLICVVADKCIDAAIDQVLRRPNALGIRDITFETIVHPRRDPGCFHESAELLAGYTTHAHHALVVLDQEWMGAPASAGTELERLLEASLQAIGTAKWARAVVIDPELEAWVFADSPHVATALGCQSFLDLRTKLEGAGLWSADRRKPADPKRAVEWALHQARRPRSSSIYREIATSVSLRRCEDPSFLRLTELLRGWFGEDQRGK